MVLLLEMIHVVASPEATMKKLTRGAWTVFDRSAINAGKKRKRVWRRIKEQWHGECGSRDRYAWDVSSSRGKYTRDTETNSAKGKFTSTCRRACNNNWSAPLSSSLFAFYYSWVSSWKYYVYLTVSLQFPLKTSYHIYVIRWDVFTMQVYKPGGTCKT